MPRKARPAVFAMSTVKFNSPACAGKLIDSPRVDIVLGILELLRYVLTNPIRKMTAS